MFYAGPPVIYFTALTCNSILSSLSRTIKLLFATSHTHTIDTIPIQDSFIGNWANFLNQKGVVKNNSIVLIPDL